MQKSPEKREKHSPYGAYSLLSFGFNAGLCSLALSRAARKRFATVMGLPDLGLIALATHKLTVIVTRERVTMTLRRPFTTQHDYGRAHGHEDAPKGSGIQRALGELLTCPYCIAPWIATAFVAGHVFAPAPTRLVSTVFSVVAASDFLNQAYSTIMAERSQIHQETEVLEHEAEAVQRETRAHATS